MTDRVIEIRLKAPAAQPAPAARPAGIRNRSRGPGNGTVSRERRDSKPDALDLVRTVASPDEEVTEQEEVGARRPSCARCRASLPRRQDRPGAWRDVRRPALRPRERPSEECASLRSGRRTVRASTRARGRPGRRSGRPAPAERGDRPPGDHRCAAMSPAFSLGRPCSSPASTELPTRPRPRGWRLRSTSAGRRLSADGGAPVRQTRTAGHSGRLARRARRQGHAEPAGERLGRDRHPGRAGGAEASRRTCD